MFLFWQVFLVVEKVVFIVYAKMVWVINSFRRRLIMHVELVLIAPLFFKMDLVSNPTPWKITVIMLLIVITRIRAMFKEVVILLVLQHLLQHHQVSSIFLLYNHHTLRIIMLFISIVFFLQIHHLDVFTPQLRGMFHDTAFWCLCTDISWAGLMGLYADLFIVAFLQNTVNCFTAGFDSRRGGES